MRVADRKQTTRMESSVSLKLHLLIVAVIVITCELSVSHCQKESCTEHTCRLPFCRCPAHSIPGGFQAGNIPQMVLIAFDDAVNWDNWHYYLRLFPPDGRRKNPNGCPISATFFVSNNFTDYCMVGKLHARGMEIGDHSVTHKMPRLWWTDADRAAMEYEVLGQRRNFVEKAHIPVEDIHGWRSPFLQPAGDDLFSVLYDNNFTYDATMTYSFPKNLYSPVLWPFTLDFGYTLVCNIARCPLKRYPGLWILPVVVLMDYRDQKPCAYVDDCANMPRDKNEAYQMLWKNFIRNYRSNRAPLYLNLHSPWLKTRYQLDALDEFLEKMTTMNDVYVVTVMQALQWQMNPTSLDQIQNFKSWQCPNFEPNMEDNKICKFSFKHKTAPKWRNGTELNESISDMSHSDTDISRIPEDIGHKTVRPSFPRGNLGKKARAGDEDEQQDNDSDVHGDNDSDDHEDDDKTHLDKEDGKKSNIRHHHHHKTHRPWFLKGDAAVSKPFIPLLFLMLVLFSFVSCEWS